ncbi:hypothetical protein [Mycoplasmopsis cynos]|nr:hypothetical protein [Mycoplasmopsis cynos]UWV92179.1 hypothetical protein NWE57_04655 [Mycoplasmopsis cynos]
MHKTYDVLNTAKNNKKLDEFSEKIDNIQAEQMQIVLNLNLIK